MKQAVKKAVVFVCAFAFAAVTQAADCWGYDVLDGTKVLGPEIQINSRDRFIIAGSLMVDDAIWTCTMYNSSTGTSGRGVFVIDGGDAVQGWPRNACP